MRLIDDLADSIVDRCVVCGGVSPTRMRRQVSVAVGGAYAEIKVSIEYCADNSACGEPMREVMPVSEHEAAVEQIRADLGAETEVSAARKEIANDLQARLEKVEAERDESISGGLAQYAALEEAAAEFERRAESIRQSPYPDPDPLTAKEEGWIRAYREDAQLLRKKQAALKGGGAK